VPTSKAPEVASDGRDVFFDTLASGLIELALSACLHPEPEPCLAREANAPAKQEVP
jgi:hypothetical protein